MGVLWVVLDAWRFVRWFLILGWGGPSPDGRRGAALASPNTTAGRFGDRPSDRTRADPWHMDWARYLVLWHGRGLPGCLIFAVRRYDTESVRLKRNVLCSERMRLCESG